MMEIRTRRLLLRPLREEDENDVIDLLTDEKITKTYLVPRFASRAEAVPLFQKIMAYSRSDDHYIRGMEYEGRIVGFLNDVSLSEAECELGWVVRPDCWGKGICTEAVSAVLPDLCRMGVRRVIAGAFDTNPASLRVMEKCGMVPIDKTEEIPYRGETHHCVFRAWEPEKKSN